MSNSYTYQILKNTTKPVVIKLTGSLDSNESNVSRISANSIPGALANNGTLLTLGDSGNTKNLYRNTVCRVWYDVNIPNGYAVLSWDGNISYPILTMSGKGEYNMTGNWMAIENNNPSSKGDIGLHTFGTTANNSYTIILELHKDNRDYNAGQLTEPGAFNYGPFGVTP